jgi:hypothetical protein
VTANRLADGEVVYLAPGDRWAEAAGEACVAAGPDEAAALLQAAERWVASRLVVAPYLIEVTLDTDGTPRPARIKEVIRARGPTVRRDLGKQAGGDEPDVPLR